MESHQLIKIASYNCRGAQNKMEYLKTLLSTADILCIQEHWLSELQLSFLGDIDDRFGYIGVSGFDRTGVLMGRPYGGCGILWRSDIACNVRVLKIDSRRICGIRLENRSWNLLIVCVYLPYEDGQLNTDVFIDQLAQLETVIEQNLDCHSVICGDFNVDFSRSWLHTALLSSFCENVNVKPVCHHPSCVIDYSYNFDMIRFQVLDHFLLSGVLYDKCVERAYVVHDVDNLSDHDPILLDIGLDIQYVGLSAKVYTPRPSWRKASQTDLFNYSSALSKELSCLPLDSDVLVCHDMKCNDILHFHALSNYVKGITDACITACNNTIPFTSVVQQGGRIAGWSEYVQPLRDKSIFWHNLWKENGRPHSGVVADCMRRSRAAYHHAVRFVKKEEDNIRCERIMNTAMLKDDTNFWSEVKKIRAKKPARDVELWIVLVVIQVLLSCLQ